jgi:SnoaL-like protein
MSEPPNDEGVARPSRETMLETLLAEREIGRALAAIARAMDERDWSVLDHWIDVGACADYGTGPLTGRVEMVALMRSYLDACGPTQHLLGNLVIDVDPSAATARSRCYVSDMHVGAGARSQQTFSTLGEYHDQWRRIGDRWWLVHRRKLSRALLGSFDVLGPGPQAKTP